MELVQEIGGGENPKGLSPEVRKLLAEGLLILNTLVLLTVVLLWGGPLWLHFGMWFQNRAVGLILVSLYFFSLFGFPLSVIFLRGIRRPKWLSAILVLNTPFYVLQLCALAVWIVVGLRNL